jgi:hypothetical protein
MKPATYRVRPFSLFGGERILQSPIGGIETRTFRPASMPPEEMAGLRLNQSWNVTGDALYTLYDSAGYTKSDGMLVHALDLRAGTARCLDVPADIEAGKGKGKLIFIDNQLIVVGRKGIVRMNPQTGEVEQKVRVQTKAVGAMFGQSRSLYFQMESRCCTTFSRCCKS